MKRAAMLLLAMGAAVSLSACGDPIERAGKLAAPTVARKVVEALPTPKPKVIVIYKGGSFCSVMRALEWPYVPSSQAEIDAMSDGNAAKIADTNDQFERCPEKAATK